jgi:hypothetical protein
MCDRIAHSPHAGGLETLRNEVEGRDKPTSTRHQGWPASKGRPVRKGVVDVN